MDKHHYKSNSHKSKERRQEEKTEEIAVAKKRFEPVISGDTKLQKKSGLRKLTETFIAEDVKTVRDYLWSDIAVPKIKQLAFDMVTNGVAKILGVENRRNPDVNASNNPPYRRWSMERNERRNSEPARNNYQQNAANYDDIIFDTRGDAELVLETMEEAVSTYGFVTILGMYDLAGCDCSAMPHTYDKYGWTNLKKASVERTQGGWYIRLPRPVAI